MTSHGFGAEPWAPGEQMPPLQANVNHAMLRHGFEDRVLQHDFSLEEMNQEYDVPGGSGPKVESFPGNVRYKSLIKNRLHRWKVAKEEEKSKLCHEVIHEVLRKGGNFYEKSKNEKGKHCRLNPHYRDQSEAIYNKVRNAFFYFASRNK